MSTHKVIPSLWFQTEGGKLTPLLAYYQLIFGENFEVGKPMPLGDTPSGNAEMCHAKLFGNTYGFMATAQEHHVLNDSFSITLLCENQDEIDNYWDYFTREGKPTQCGWCIDKFGLRWQVIPTNLGQLMSRPNAWQVMMKQTKIIIAEY